jgi:Acetyltransferase (GNAT) domain
MTNPSLWPIDSEPEAGPTHASNSQSLRVAETNPQTDPRWESLVNEHPNGSIYHHPAWLQVLEREYGQKGLHFICEDVSGRVRAILPMQYTRGLPLGFKRAVAGRRLSSLPRTPLAGPLSLDTGATIALLKEAVRRAAVNPGIQLQIKMQSRDLDGLVDGLLSRPWRMSYLLRLPKSSEGPFRIPNSHSRASIKWAVNKATKLGVVVRPAETESDLSVWYALYLETMRRNVVPPRSYRFFAALWDLLRPRGMMQLVLAEQEVRGRRRIIAGSIFFMFGRTVSYAFSGSCLKDFPLRANDVIQWRAINEACKNGYCYFDFGEVPEGNDELAKFKTKWGAEPVRLHRYYYPSPPDSIAESVESVGYGEMLRNAVWRRLPLPAISWIGNRIFSYL